MGSPAGSAGFGNPIRKRAGGSTTCSVEVLFVSSRGSSDGDWWFCCVRMAPLALGTCREQSIVGCMASVGYAGLLAVQCSSEGPYVGGGAGSSFSGCLLPTTTIVSGMTAVTTVLDLPILVECILNIDRRRTLVRRLKLLRACLQWTAPCMHIIYLHRR